MISIKEWVRRALGRLRYGERFEFSDAWDEGERPWQRRLIRGLSDDELFRALAVEQVGTPYRYALEAEQRRREAWTGPSGRAARLSYISLAVSLGALSVGAVSAYATWTKIQVEPDLLQLKPEGRVSVPSKAKFDQMPIPLPSGEIATNTIAPVVWRLVVYNPGDRPVSILGVQLAYSHPRGEIRWSNMLGSVVDPVANQRLQFPITLAAREARSVLISASVPMARPGVQEDECVRSDLAPNDVEQCFFGHGRDLFGNKVRRIGPPGSSLVTWLGHPESPPFRVELETGDRSRFSALLTYYPQHS